MNMMARHRPAAPERVRFTLADVLHMQADGLFGDTDVELIEGEIYAMPSEGELHLDMKEALTRWLISHLGPEYGVIVEGTLKLSDATAPSPDFWIYPKPGKAAAQRGPDVLLVIEIAVSSRDHDLGLKARIYREHGVREYWVIDPVARVTHEHRLDGAGTADQWPAAPVGFAAALRPTLLPALEISIAGVGV